MSENLDAKYLNYNQSFDESSFDLKINDKEYHTKTSLVGKHQASNITGASLVTAIENLDLGKALGSLIDMKPVEGRGNIIKVKFSGREILIINDAYNASPDSMKASFENYKYAKSDKKAIIIGDMRELGKDSKQYHEDLAQYVIKSRAKIIIMIGPFMKYLYDKLVCNDDEITCFHFSDLDSAIKEIEKSLQDSDMVLVKASNGMQLYKIVEYLKG